MTWEKIFLVICAWEIGKYLGEKSAIYIKEFRTQVARAKVLGPKTQIQEKKENPSL